jgi:transcriptional regulator with XRE-family HTH domain
MRGKPGPDDATLAARIRELKSHCHCSVRQLADAIGEKKSNVGDYVSGKTPIPSAVLGRIAFALGCDPRYLFMPPGSSLPKTARRFRRPAQTKPPMTLLIDGSFVPSRPMRRMAWMDIDLIAYIPTRGFLAPRHKARL